MNFSGWTEREIMAFYDSNGKKVPARLKKAKKKPARKKPARKKATAKKTKKPHKKLEERVDRWRLGKLYRARDFRFYPEDHLLVTPDDFAEGRYDYWSLPTKSHPKGKLEPLTLNAAREFVAAHHYLHKLGKQLRFVYGLYHKPSKELVGIASYGSPSYTHVLPASFPDVKKISQVGSELNRLVLLDEVPRNAEGWFIRESQRDLSERRQKAVISFSDPVAGHVGTVYKATEAAYTGQSRERKAYVYNDTGLPVTPNDQHKLKAGCPVHRPAYKRKAATLAKKGLSDQEIKRRMRGQCGSGNSISGWEASIRNFEAHGAPPYQEGTCLGEWRDAVLPLIASKGPVPGKHRYLWDLPRSTKGLSKRAVRKERKRAWEATRKRHTVQYPCGVCQATTHKTWECPGFKIKKETPEWLRDKLGKNPDGRPMRSEQRLAEIRRRLAAGDQSAGPALLAELERSGKLNQAQLQILAYLNDPWVKPLGVKPPPGGRGFGRISNEIRDWFTDLQTAARADVVFSDMILAAASSAFDLYPGIEPDRIGGVRRYLGDILRRATRFGTATVAKVMVRGFNRLLAPSDPPILRAVGRFAALQADTEEVWPAARHVSAAAASVLEQAHHIVVVQNFDRCRNPDRVTCGSCERSWCERCDPGRGCHWCAGRGYSTAELPDEQSRRRARRAASPELRNMIRSTLYDWWKIA